MDKNEIKQIVRELLDEEYVGWKAPVLPGNALEGDILVAKESFIDPPLDISNKVEWKTPEDGDPTPSEDYVKSVNDIEPDVNGNVELKASDIEVTNSQSVQANLERIDESLEDAIDDIAALQEGKQHKLIAGSNITITPGVDGDTIAATGGGGGGANWGEIGGTLSNQTDLVNALLNKADKNNTYTKSEVDSALNDKADVADLDDKADQSEVDTLSDRVDTAEGDIETLNTEVAGKSTVSGQNDGTNWTKITIDGVEKNIPAGGSSGAAWGQITGTLSNQTDLSTALANKAAQTEVDSLDGRVETLEDSVGDIETELNNKVDKISGKGLSTNDYDNTEKAKVAEVDNKVDKVTGKGLSTNDYTTTEKNKVALINSTESLVFTLADSSTVTVKVVTGV